MSLLVIAPMPEEAPVIRVVPSVSVVLIFRLANAVPPPLKEFYVAHIRFNRVRCTDAIKREDESIGRWYRRYFGIDFSSTSGRATSGSRMSRACRYPLEVAPSRRRPAPKYDGRSPMEWRLLVLESDS